MKVLVFGGAGFLGSSLLPKLRARGHDVVAPRSSEIDLRQLPGPRPEFEGVEAVIHAAAIYGGMPFDMENSTDILSANMRMNINVFDLCKGIRPARLVTIGSACAYPGYSTDDFTEEHFFTGPLHRTVACHGFTKLAMMVAHQVHFDSYGLKGVHLVPANLYGPVDVYRIDRAHVVAALIKKYSDAVEGGGDVTLMGDGTAIREFLYIDDLSDMIVAALERPVNGYEVINAGTGVGHSIRQLAEILADKLGFSGRTVWDGGENGAMRKVMKVDRLQRVLGPFEPLSLEQGIERTLEWYLPNKAAADARA